jgi:hypothetical protein
MFGSHPYGRLLEQSVRDLLVATGHPDAEVEVGGAETTFDGSGAGRLTLPPATRPAPEPLDDASQATQVRLCFI